MSDSTTPVSRMGALIAGSAISAVCGVLYAWSVFVLPLEELFHWSRRDLSLTFTFVLVSFSVGMFAGGALTSRKGPKLSVVLGAILLGAGMWTASLATSLSVLYLGYGILAGFGIGMINIVPTTVCLTLFPERKGLIGGVLTMALAFGTLLIGSVGAGRLISAFGVQMTFRVLAVALPLVACAGAVFMTMPAHSAKNSSGFGGLTLRETLQTKDYWLLWLWMFLLQTGGLMVIGHLVPFVRGISYGAETAAFMLGVYAVCNGLGRPLFGMLIDHFGRLVSMSLNAGLLACGLVALVLQSASHSPYLLFPCVVCVGLAYGGGIPQLAAMCMTLFGPRHFSEVYGFSTTPTMVGGLSGPFLGGALFVAFGSYHTAFLVAACVAACAVVPACLLRRAAPFDQR